MAAEEGNGSNDSAQGKRRQLILTFDSDTHTMEISGKIANTEQALSMLAMATREYERQLRAQQAITLQQQLQDMARSAKIAESLRGN